MKLERLLTLSQFVDLHHTKWALVREYNNFLKQPLTKDMFVNQIDKSMYGYHNVFDREFEEAEKKVIFELDGKIEDGSNGIWYCGYFIYFNTPLHKVAEITKGQLKLKNVQL